MRGQFWCIFGFSSNQKVGYEVYECMGSEGFDCIIWSDDVINDCGIAI
jgi:hypothetical protein